MRRLSLAHKPLVPPDPAEVAISRFGWRRVGFLQRLVKLDNAD